MAKKKGKARKKAGRTKRTLLGRARKAASAFLSSEEGKVLKADIVRTAVSLGLVALGAGAAEAQHSDTPHGDSHTNVAHSDYARHALHNDGATSGHYSTHGSQAGQNTHSNQPAHSDHSNHSSHGSGGWC